MKETTLDLFCFASRNEGNIRRGIEAHKRAVATVGEADAKARRTKGRRYFSIGSRGLLYCSPLDCFTTPFVVESNADPVEVVKDVWPEPWILPFAIRPLGDLSRQVSKESAELRWPLLHRPRPYANITAAMNITGTTVFVPLDITDEDWAIILDDLAG